ncbi:MAG: hydroxymethylpyrimidine/phosphomethylpyrimidine kinase [Bacteroidales bacterium]|nr:hydroxymethylpyrimidine/phosphomethylpyrimidine kinase [Bacteroidales bacterium]
MKFVITIAASDSSGGAGIQRDVQVIRDFNLWPLTVLTGITVQNFDKVTFIQPVSPKLLYKQLKICFDSFHISSIKIGAICSVENIGVINKIINKNTKIPIVLDPVLASSSGKLFLSKKKINKLINELFPFVSIITPNKPELEILTNKKINSIDDAIEVASSLVNQFNVSIYIKGGHFEGNEIQEAFVNSKVVRKFSQPRFHFKYKHGTGCTFSTALACLLAKESHPENACFIASKYVANEYQKISDQLNISNLIFH